MNLIFSLIFLKKLREAFHSTAIIIHRGESFRYFHKITFQVGEKEWEKYRVAFVIQGKPHYLEDDDKSINTKV